MNVRNTVGVATQRILQLAGESSDLPHAVEIVTSRILEGISCPPTDLPNLLASLNVKKCEAADIPVNGELRRSGKAYEICYSTDLPPSRRRFTIAHELGHVILASTGPRCPQSGEEVERICDMLASGLLLPRTHFVEAVGDDRSPQAILSAAQIFEVSLVSAAIRFASLFKVSVFEVGEGKVLWGHGIIKRGYVTGDIKASVDKSVYGSGEDVVLLNTGRTVWLQWMPSGGGKRALFTALPKKAKF